MQQLLNCDIILPEETSFPKIQTVLKRASRGDFWVVSGTKWLNRPYKAGIVVVIAAILLLR